MEPGASNNPLDPHKNLLFVAPWWRGFKALLSQDGWRDLKVVLGQPITAPYVRVSQTCSPKAFAKSFDDHSSSNI
eukprot:370569-Pelagomonas_calceolata.AAC.1